MTDLLLVRHATCDAVGVSIAGRAPGVHLSAQGVAQAEALAARLAAIPLDAIVSSPLERTYETAERLARGRGLHVECMDALLELDFGEWTGLAFAELGDDPRWRLWNSSRSLARIPGGETMIEAQARAVSALLQVRDRWPNGRCAVVAHGDIIRGAIAYVLGMPLDHMLRFDIAPASVSVLQITREYARVLSVNGSGV